MTKWLKNKLLIGFAITIPLGVAVKRLNDFYKRNFPVSREGVCLRLDAPGSDYALVKVLQNEGTSKTAIVGIYDKDVIYTFDFLSYEELRQMKPVEVKCPDEKN